ncbi:MAG TPA: thiamine phosphate synthase [Candidatus Sulfotelmatobacter sp.]|nr:thiamine phosphate synthase [Candidatus Sulfotelmatobacter sp.]
MAERCLLYYITDRKVFAQDEPSRYRSLLEKIEEAATAGVDYIQLREKDLETRVLESLALEAVRVVRKVQNGNTELKTAILINSRADIALCSEADGVHLRSGDISPEIVQRVWQRRSHGIRGRSPLIGVSCHSPAEVDQAAVKGATFAVFAPVFGKKDAPESNPAGLESLMRACKANIPVLALGGVTLANAGACLEAGASGISGIRLFQENDVSNVVQSLRR